MDKKPTTQREMLEQLWYALIGTNGEGALEKLNILYDEFREFLRTRAETCPVRVEQNKRRVLPATWIMAVIAFMAVATTWILRAWK